MADTDQTLTGTTDANGNCTLTFIPKNRQNWRVDQCSGYAPDVGGSAQCVIYRDYVFVCEVVPQAFATEPPSINVRNGSKFRVVWSSCLPNKSVQATIFYDDGNPS